MDNYSGYIYEEDDDDDCVNQCSPIIENAIENYSNVYSIGVNSITEINDINEKTAISSLDSKNYDNSDFTNENDKNLDRVIDVAKTTNETIKWGVEWAKKYEYKSLEVPGKVESASKAFIIYDGYEYLEKYNRYLKEENYRSAFALSFNTLGNITLSVYATPLIGISFTIISEKYELGEKLFDLINEVIDTDTSNEYLYGGIPF